MAEARGHDSGFSRTGKIRSIARHVGEEWGQVQDAESRETSDFQAVPLLWVLATALQRTGV